MDLSGFSVNSAHIAGRVSQVAVRLLRDNVYGSVKVFIFGSVNEVIGIVIDDSEVEGSSVSAGRNALEAPAGAAQAGARDSTWNTPNVREGRQGVKVGVMQCQTREGDGREGCVGVAVISILYDKNRVCKYWQGEGREKSKNQSELHRRGAV